MILELKMKLKILIVELYNYRKCIYFVLIDNSNVKIKKYIYKPRAWVSQKNIDIY